MGASSRWHSSCVQLVRRSSLVTCSYLQGRESDEELGQANVTLSPLGELTAGDSQRESLRERKRGPWNRGSGLQRRVVARRHS